MTSEVARDEPWTVARVLRWAAEDFRGRGFDSPRLDAELLLAHVLGVDRVRLIVDAERPLSPEELAAFRGLIQRRRRHEPVAYILGVREFYGLPLRVDRRVLIPRPDTETLVEVALARTRSRSMFGRALDLCTGSGAVAVAFARERPTWEVTGVDVSPGAVELSRENAHRAGAIGGVRFVVGDLYEAVAGSSFDLVTANPPYIPRGDLAGLPADVRDFEPRAALDGGVDGLELTRRVVAEAPRHLREGGVLAVEVGHDQAPRVAGLFEQAGFEKVERRRDYGGIERVVSGRKPLTRPAPGSLASGGASG